MSGVVCALLAFLAGLGVTVLGDMVSEEVRDRLDHIPHFMLKLAARRLDAGQRSAVYEDEWLPELTYILKGAETRPITRLFTGIRYALGILASVRRIARRLHRSALGQPGPALPVLPLPSKAEIDSQFWGRYRRYLEEGKLMPAQAVHQLDEATDRVLARLQDPRRGGSWRSGGLVEVPVQSGMTSNYVSLACKAADAGYKLIVVLTANHNLVRSQTQRQVDEAFLGFDSGRVISLTDSDGEGDFKPWVAMKEMPIGDSTAVLVIKKNPRILRHVRNWIATLEGPPAADGRPIGSFPVLVIDAEAGSSPVNVTALDEETGRPRVNADVQRLLESFGKYAYIGYAATLFASARLQLGVADKYRDAVFPRDFVVRLEAPSTYFGPERVFGSQLDDREDSLGPFPIMRFVTDYDSWMPCGHRKSWIPPSQLPGSLSEAICAFVLACATRRARGQVADHNSMLIHVTRFRDVQSRVTGQVIEHLALLKDRVGCGVAEQGLRSLWERDFVSTSATFPPGQASPVTWGQIWPEVRSAVEKIQVQAVNGTAASPLQYHEYRQEGLSVIAVGGNTLPPGLDLEGFTVGYYLQASPISGTLLQMGRSFGYRPGYEDLCRLYATPTLNDSWVEITAAREGTS